MEVTAPNTGPLQAVPTVSPTEFAPLDQPPALTSEDTFCVFSFPHWGHWKACAVTSTGETAGGVATGAYAAGTGMAGVAIGRAGAADGAANRLRYSWLQELQEDAVIAAGVLQRGQYLTAGCMM